MCFPRDFSVGFVLKKGSISPLFACLKQVEEVMPRYTFIYRNYITNQNFASLTGASTDYQCIKTGISF